MERIRKTLSPTYTRRRRLGRRVVMKVLVDIPTWSELECHYRVS